MALDAIGFAAMRAGARDGRWFRFDVVFVLKLLPVNFLGAGEIQMQPDFLPFDRLRTSGGRKYRPYWQRASAYLHQSDHVLISFACPIISSIQAPFLMADLICCATFCVFTYGMRFLSIPIRYA